MNARHVIGTLALVAACRAAPPAPPAAAGRAVLGTVQLRVGPLIQGFDLRADYAPAGFITVLHPIAGALPVPVAGALAAGLADVPFVRDNEPLPANPVLFETPVGVIAATLVYRPLGEWLVLDHLDAELADRAGPVFHLSLHGARLEP
jgi:hypothetical protein